MLELTVIAELQWQQISQELDGLFGGECRPSLSGLGRRVAGRRVSVTGKVFGTARNSPPSDCIMTLSHIQCCPRMIQLTVNGRISNVKIG